MHVAPETGVCAHHVAALAKALDIPKEAGKSFRKFVVGLYDIYMARDCSMVEINPLILTGGNEIPT